MQPERNTQLKNLTTLQVGGPAEYFFDVTTLDDLEAALQFARQTAAPLLILGGGSNVLISDTGFNGVVIRNSLKGISFEQTKEGVLAVVAAGENWDDFVAKTVEHGYWGLENMSSIPGTVGATPIQNVGAYGVEVSEFIQSVTAVNVETGKTKTFNHTECQFAYRDSYFKTEAGRQWCITEVRFILQTDPSPILSYKDLQSLQDQAGLTQLVIREAVINIRSQKFPDWTVVGTAGSFFKNPIVPSSHFEQLKEQYPDLPGYEAGEDQTKVSLGWILDKVCDLKGYCDGSVCLYQNQALVLTNTGDSAAAVQQFAQAIQEKVKEKTGIDIEPEVRLVS